MSLYFNAILAQRVKRSFPYRKGMSYYMYSLRRRSNSIPWCTSFHVILLLRTWHIMISNLQHARNEHRSARCGWFQTCFGSAASAFEIIELAYIHCALKENFSVTLTKKGFTCVSLICREQLVRSVATTNTVWDSATDKVHWENRNHGLSKKWLQENSLYAVKLITKGGFITASCSKEPVDLQGFFG